MAQKRHWDPNNPNHFHILNGELTPTDYSGTAGVVQYEDGIVDPKVQQWIAEHQIAMNKDEHKYIDNPAYTAIQSKLNQAKSIYDWGNSVVGLPNNSNKTQWQHNYPYPELTFDANGVGYKDGQTYLPGSGSNGFIVPGPSSTSSSQNYSYVPTNIPDKQILRTEFPTPQTISKEAYDAEKQRAVQEYINNNTRKEYLIAPSFLFHRGLEGDDVENYFGRNLEYAPPLNKKVIQDMKSQGLDLNKLVWEETPSYYKPRSYMPFPMDYQTAKTLQTNAYNSWIDDEIKTSNILGFDHSEQIKHWIRQRDTNSGIRSITTKPSIREAKQNAQINYGNLTNNIFAKGGPIPDKPPTYPLSLSFKEMQSNPNYYGPRTTLAQTLTPANYWMDLTGRSWEDAKTLHYTDGSTESNIELFNRLRNPKLSAQLSELKNTYAFDALPDQLLAQYFPKIYIPSDNIINYIKQTERFMPNVYKDGNGIPTIGYGFTAQALLDKYKNGITRQQADQEFQKILTGYAKELQTTPNWSELNQNQRDALLSYYYNIGGTNYYHKSPKLQQALREKNWNAVPKQMDFGYEDTTNPGLRVRRDFERKLWMTPVND